MRRHCEQLRVRVNAGRDVTARVTHVAGYWRGRAELWLVFDNELRSWVASAPTRMLYVQIIYRLIKKFPFSGSRRWESAADGLILGKVRTRVKCQRSCCRLGTPTTSHSVQFSVLKRMLFECSGLMERAVKIFWGDQFSGWPAGNHLSQNDFKMVFVALSFCILRLNYKLYKT